MDEHRPDAAVGALLLGLILAAAALVPPVLRPSAPASLPAADLPPAGMEAATAAALGWPLEPGEPDPRAWEELPGVGPVLAARLAEAAAAGRLRRPADLLRVRGIGATMAAAVEPLVRWETP